MTLSAHVPRDVASVTKMKETMRSYCPPYPQFSSFYPLVEIITVYDEMWKEEGSDS